MVKRCPGVGPRWWRFCARLRYTSLTTTLSRRRHRHTYRSLSPEGSHMRYRRNRVGQAVIPVALLALVALIGGLLYQPRGLEASHRATAAHALRYYPGLGAWHYSPQAGDV